MYSIPVKAALSLHLSAHCVLQYLVVLVRFFFNEHKAANLMVQGQDCRLDTATLSIPNLWDLRWAHCCERPLVFVGHCLWEELDEGEHSDFSLFQYGVCFFNKFHVFCGTRGYIIAFSRARHLVLPSATLIQAIPPPPLPGKNKEISIMCLLFWVTMV